MQVHDENAIFCFQIHLYLHIVELVQERRKVQLKESENGETESRTTSE